MKKLLSLLLPIAFIILVVVAVAAYLATHQSVMLHPQGVVAAREKTLIIITLSLALIVVLPVFFMTFYFVWRYREDSPRGAYRPDWHHSRRLEAIWWGIPCMIILALGIITWKSSHDLDPYKPIAGTTKPMTIQVVALDWKWLFIYPDQHIATVNYVQFPAGKPVDFEITADAPMNSFWIPQLGSQIYAMPGMTTHLNALATAEGDYQGTSANLSGAGFAGMRFTARASSSADFDRWVGLVRQGRDPLTAGGYDQLAKQSENMPKTTFSSVPGDLFTTIVNKYMTPPAGTGDDHAAGMDGMDMTH